jgi:hypothetical protein
MDIPYKTHDKTVQATWWIMKEPSGMSALDRNHINQYIPKKAVRTLHKYTPYPLSGQGPFFGKKTGAAGIASR